MNDTSKILVAGLTFLTSLMLLVLLAPAPARAGEGLTAWKIDVGVSSVYDDNILRYSDKYLDRFDRREDLGRFHINTADDLILVSSIKGTLTMNLIGALNTTGSIDYRHRTYTHNAIKDWSYLSMSLRQDLSKKLSAQVGYNYIPEFYVRHYRDDNWVNNYGYTPITFQPFGFKKDEMNGWIQYNPLSNTRVRAGLRFMQYYHNEHFTEYNCRNRAFGFDVYQTVLKNIRLNASFEAMYSRADGDFDTDPSNDQNTFVFGADFRLPKVFGHANSVGVEGEHGRTFYTTHNFVEVDPEHAGRKDYVYRVSITYDFGLLDNLTLAVNYTWQERTSRSSSDLNATYLADEKDYRQHQVSLEARYSLSFVPSDDSENERSK